jgi:hypothetical protein
MVRLVALVAAVVVIYLGALVSASSYLAIFTK